LKARSCKTPAGEFSRPELVGPARISLPWMRAVSLADTALR